MTPSDTTELTVDQYELLSSLLPPETETGRPRTVNMMSFVQGIMYILVGGNAWRLSCCAFYVGEPDERAPLMPKEYERTYGWLHWCRRLNVDYERLPASSEAFIHIAMIRLMLRRLA